MSPSWIDTLTNPNRWGLTRVKCLLHLRDHVIHFLGTASSHLHIVIFVCDKETEAQGWEVPCPGRG